MNQVAGLVGCAAVTVGLCSSLASAQQVMWKDNPITGKVVGLTYGTSSWTAAEAQAVAYGGHLVTIRSSAERDWLASQFASGWTATATFGSGYGPWVGLYEDFTTTPASWRWSSGEATLGSAIEWFPAEPNNTGGNENFANLHPPTWLLNDFADSQPMKSLIEVAQRPARSWSWPTVYSTGSFPLYGCTFDMDGDGDLDYASPDNQSSRVSIWRNNGQGEFALVHVFSSVGFVVTTLADDWDGDGDLDLLVAQTGGSVKLLENAGGGSSWSTPVVVASSAGYAYGLAIADVNSDGAKDLVVTAVEDDDRVRVFLRQPNGTVAQFPAVYGPYFNDASQPTLADLDNDGHLDLLVVGGGLRLLRGSATGAFTDLGNIGVGRATRCGVIDLQGDGLKEILVVRNVDNTLEVWAAGGAMPLNVGNYTRTQILSSGTVPHWVETGDLDGDGDADVVVPAYGSGTVHIWRNDTGVLVADHVLVGQSGALYAAVADLNGDAKLDVLTSNASVNAFGVHFNQSIADCNANGIDDPLDISSGVATDCNLNGRPDTCEVLTPQTDCDGNGTLDTCQPLTPVNDCNTNGQLDVCETAAGTALDCNLNSRPDSCDLAAGAPDCNLNQIPDSCDLGTGVSLDADFNSIPDECSLDCNGNGLLDTAECLQGLVADCNTNLVPDSCDVAGSVPDCNANGVPDSCDVATGGDCNGNNTPDVCDLAAGAPDCNGNGLLDACDLAAGAADCDANLVPDVCQALDASSDCNANMVLDVCDILAGAPDCNANGRPDSCEPDTNNDGVADDCQDSGTPFCFGDGTANSTPCPCGGVGAPRSGCPNSANPLGGYLAAVGLPSRTADTLVLRGSQMPPIATVLYFQGTSQATAAGGTIGTVFGDGLRCASGAVLRLGFRTNVGGASELPSGGSPALHIVGQIPASGAVTRYYQGWYRDASPTFCTTNRYNLTNGVAVVWVP